MQVGKWGNSLAVRLPASIVEALGLKEGDEIEIHVADEREFGVSRKPGREELLKRLRAFRGRLPADFKFDRDEANARPQRHQRQGKRRGDECARKNRRPRYAGNRVDRRIDSGHCRQGRTGRDCRL